MNPREGPDIIEEQETSLFKADTLSRGKKYHHQNHPSPFRNQSLVIPILFVLLIALFTIYLIERKDKELSDRITQLKDIRIQLLESKKQQLKLNQNEEPGKEQLVENVNYELFDDQKVTKTKHIPDQVRSKPVKADENNPIMKTYLQGVNQTIKKGTNISDLIEEMLKNKDKDKLVIPRKIWIFSQNQEEQTEFVKACLNNTRRIANNSGFSVTIVNPTNFQQYVTRERAQLYNQTISVLVKESVSNPVSGYDAVIPDLKRQLALLQVLHQQGGIIMDSNVVLTEDLSWLIQVPTNPYVNCGNPDFPTKYFGFHNVNFTSNEEKFFNEDGTWKFIAKYIGLESFFFGGMAKQQFLEQILKVIHICFVNPQSTRSTLSALKIGKAISNIFIISNAFPIACRVVLKQKEKLSEKGLLALDYFGIKSINSYFFPKKLNHYFQYSFQDKIFQNLASLTIAELQQNVGPLKYMALVPYDSYINDRLTKIFATTLSAENNQITLLHPHSFLTQYLFPDVEKHHLESELEYNQSNSKEQLWEALPKIIWTQQPGDKKRNLIEKILFENVKKQAEKDGFEVREVNPLYFEEWLNKQEIDWIKNTVNKAKTKVYGKMKLQLAKLHILIRYGGIWLSKHFFTVDSFQWLPKIKNQPSSFVFNRYGNLPQVVMYFYPHYGQPFEWTYDSSANTKNMWHVALDSNFIATQPEAQLLKDWVRYLTKFMTRPFKQNLDQMSRLKVDTERWTVKDNAYFASLDSVKMVLANKQRELNNLVTDNDTYVGPKSSPQFYRVWSISGARGPLKLDSTFASLSVQKGDLNPKSNSLIWRYPQAYTEGIVGKIHKVTKLYHINSIELLRIYQKEQTFKSQTEGQIHPQSIFSNYLRLLSAKDGK